MNYICNMLFSGIYGIVLEQQHEITLDYWSTLQPPCVCPLPLSYHHVRGYKVSGTLIWRSTRSVENSRRTGMLVVVVLHNTFLHIKQFGLTSTVVSIPNNFDLILNTTNTLIFPNSTPSLSVILVSIFLYSQYLLMPSPILAVYESEILGQVIWAHSHKPIFWGIRSFLGDSYEW